MLKKILIIFLFNLFIFSNGYSLDFNNVYNIKNFSSAAFEMNDTNLIDQENAENLIKNIEILDTILEEKSKESRSEASDLVGNILIVDDNSPDKTSLKVKFFFPTALKGDLLNKETIDVMMQGGALGVNVSLESASPRMQKVMRKNLDIEKFREIIKPSKKIWRVRKFYINVIFCLK